MVDILAKVLVEGKGVSVREGLKEVGVQSYEPTCLHVSACAEGRQATHKQASTQGGMGAGGGTPRLPDSAVHCMN